VSPASGSGLSSTVFVDTDVLVHVRDTTDSRKQQRADEWITDLWRTRTGRTSFQVLEEYYFVVTERLEPGLDPAIAREDVRDLLAWRPFSVDRTVLEGAWSLHVDRQLGWWDAVAVATAQVGGCGHFLTGALPHGRKIGELGVINPFERPPSPYVVHDVTHPRETKPDTSGGR
jgi:predicted nucleic acid-binding protein